MAFPIGALNACRAASLVGMMNHSEDDEEERKEEENEEFWADDVGFDPYLGCYTDDC